MILTPRQIYQLARDAGFPPVVAVTMTAIGLRESGGNTDAFNGNEKTGDRSYGIFQINMIGSLGRRRLKIFNLANNDPEQLFDPAENARAAFLTWGGSNKTLSSAWYIDKPKYREAYEKHLPAAQAAALMDAPGVSRT